jgi:hypothetical protein
MSRAEIETGKARAVWAHARDRHVVHAPHRQERGDEVRALLAAGEMLVVRAPRGAQKLGRGGRAVEDLAVGHAAHDHVGRAGLEHLAQKLLGLLLALLGSAAERGVGLHHHEAVSARGAKRDLEALARRAPDLDGGRLEPVAERRLERREAVPVPPRQHAPRLPFPEQDHPIEAWAEDSGQRGVQRQEGRVEAEERGGLVEHGNADRKGFDHVRQERRLGHGPIGGRAVRRASHRQANAASDRGAGSRV